MPYLCSLSQPLCVHVNMYHCTDFEADLQEPGVFSFALYTNQKCPLLHSTSFQILYSYVILTLVTVNTRVESIAHANQLKYATDLTHCT